MTASHCRCSPSSEHSARSIRQISVTVPTCPGKWSGVYYQTGQWDTRSGIPGRQNAECRLRIQPVWVFEQDEGSLFTYVTYGDADSYLEKTRDR